MSDSNENFNKGAWGQAPPAGGNALDQWAAGKGTRQWNERELARQGGRPRPPPPTRPSSIRLLLTREYSISGS